MPDTSTQSDWPIVVGSRSPRRLELLQTFLPAERLRVVPPVNAHEEGFEGLTTLEQFEERIQQIVAAKRDDVWRQCLSPQNPLADVDGFFLLAADTTVMVEDEQQRLLSLGQPQESADWQATTRDWFRRYLSGRSHRVLSAVSVSRCEPRQRKWQTVTAHCVTTVEMHPYDENWMNWYLATNEPLGKAGAYAVQGAGSVFVSRIEGSYSNVVGLPLEETVALLQELRAV